MRFEEILIEIMVLEPESGIDEFMKRKPSIYADYLTSTGVKST